MSESTAKKKAVLNIDQVDFVDIAPFAEAINLDVLKTGNTDELCLLKLNSKQIDNKKGAENCLILEQDFFKNPLFKNYLNMLLEGEFHNNYEELFNLKELQTKELRVVNLKRVGHYTDLLVEDFVNSKITRNWRDEIEKLFESLVRWKNEKHLGIPFEINYFVQDELIILQCTTHYNDNELMDLDLFRLGDFSSLVFLKNPKTFIWNIFWYKENPVEKNSLAIFSNMTLQKNNYIFRENDVYTWAFNNKLSLVPNDNDEILDYNRIKGQITPKDTVQIVEGLPSDEELKQTIKGVTDHIEDETILVKGVDTFRYGLTLLNKISADKMMTEDEYLHLKHAHLLGMKAIHFLTQYQKSLEEQTPDKVIVEGVSTEVDSNFEIEVQRQVDKRIELLKAQMDNSTDSDNQLLEKQLKVMTDKYNDLVSQINDRVSEENKKSDTQANFYKNESARLTSEVLALKSEIEKLEREVRELQLIIRRKEAEEKSGSNMKGDSKSHKVDNDKKVEDPKDMKSPEAKFKFKITVLEKNLAKVEEEKKKALEDVSALKAQAAKMKSENIALNNELDKVSNKLKRLSSG
ncbi:MAG: hypothetical protein U0T83_00845 [Bacteriovoracaceae bacterium]